jgi:hypothetical protein
MTITLNGYPEIPLHPLDLSTQSQTDPSSSTCVGLIQTDGGVMDTSPTVSDMILGVAFLRNVYTVMAYDAPDAHGVFPANNDSASLQPRVGLLSLTNATRAMQEFNNVRVLNEPLGNSSSPTSGQASGSRSGKLSIGVDVLLALVGIIMGCVALFGLRWFHVRRRLRQGLHTNATDNKPAGASTTYSLAPNASFSSVDLAPGISSGMSIAGNSARTVVNQDGAAFDEFGQRKPKGKDGGDEGERVVSYLNLDPGDPSGWRDTLVGSTVDFPKLSSEPASALEAVMLASDEPMSSTRDAALAASIAAGHPMHRHNASDIGSLPEETGVVEPLLSSTALHARDDSAASFGAMSTRSARPTVFSDDEDLAEFGVGRESMAGVGTAARSSRIRGRHGGDSSGSLGSISLASVGGPGPSHAPRPSIDGRFPSMGPGERLSAYFTPGEAAFNAAQPPLPPPPPPPPS